MDAGHRTTDEDFPEEHGSPSAARRVLPRSRLVVWLTMIAWILGVTMLTPVAAELESVQSEDVTDFLPADAASTEVSRIAEAVQGRDAGEVLVVYHRPGGLTSADRASAERDRATLTDTVAPASSLVPSEDGSAVFYSVSQPEFPAEVDAEDAAATFVADIRNAVTIDVDGLSVHVTGPTALDVDIDEVFDGINTTLLLVTAIVVAVLLILIYRSPFLWLVPLISVGAAAVAATAAVYLIASAADLAVSTPNVTIMIVLVFGAGTDYALLLVARYREDLHHYRSRYSAMYRALRRAGPAILASGSTTSLGLLCLTTAQMNDIRGLGVVGSVGIAATVVTMLTLLPVALVVVGRHAFWPFVPAIGSPATNDRGRWSKIAGTVTRSPGRTLAGSTLVLGTLAVGAFTVPANLPQLDSFTSSTESVDGYHTLSAAYPDQGGRPVTIAVPPAAEDAAIRAAELTSGIDEISRDGRDADWVLIEAGVSATPDSDAEAATVLELRERLELALGSAALVGGAGAERIDVSEAVAADSAVVIPLVLVVVLVVLVVLLRAVVASLIVVVAVVLSFAAALGVGSLAFEHLFGFAGAEPDMPLLTFVFLVVLGVDYAIFMVTRLRDDKRHDMGAAARTALESTGPVVVSAGIVLASTFGILMTLPYVPMVQIGFVVAVGVLLQTLVIQATFVTPMAVWLGQRWWWPQRSPHDGRSGAEPDLVTAGTAMGDDAQQ